MKKVAWLCLGSALVGIGIGLLLKTPKKVEKEVKEYEKFKKDHCVPGIDLKEIILKIAITPEPRKHEKKLLKELIKNISLDTDTLNFLSEKASPWAKKIIF